MFYEVYFEMRSPISRWSKASRVFVKTGNREGKREILTIMTIMMILSG